MNVLLLQRELCTEPRQGALLRGDQRDLPAGRNRKQILGLLSFSAEIKGNSSLGFTYCATLGDKIPFSLPVERAEMNIRCSEVA